MVSIPDAIRVKCSAALGEWRWPWVFPATHDYRERGTDRRLCHHLHETVIQRPTRAAAMDADITKLVTPHT
jgi:hypothetical protein